MSFALDISKFVEKTKGKTDLFVREFNQDLADKVQENTPYKTGTLRAGWTLGINAPDAAPSSPANAARIALTLQGVKAGATVFHSNNVKYGPFVEFGTRFMEARAFVRKTVAQAPQIAESVLRRISNL